MGLGVLTFLRIKARAALYEWRVDQRGMEMIEIVLIAALVIIGSIVFWKFLGTAVTKRLWDLCNGVNEGHCGVDPQP